MSPRMSKWGTPVDLEWNPNKRNKRSERARGALRLLAARQMRLYMKSNRRLYVEQYQQSGAGSYTFRVYVKPQVLKNEYVDVTELCCYILRRMPTPSQRLSFQDERSTAWEVTIARSVSVSIYADADWIIAEWFPGSRFVTLWSDD